jgi:Zn-dependent M32 family carboxypeptidase
MENVITRIVEIEKQCAQDIANAEQEYKKRIEDHKRTLEEKKAQAFNDTVAEGNTRLARLIEEAKRKTQADSLAARSSFDRLYKDSLLHEAIKEKIVSILLKT